MSNRELYRETFGKLHTSESLCLKESKMRNRGTGFRCKRSLVVVMAVIILTLAMSCIGYAATDGQIFNNIKVWINGEQVEASDYRTEDGNIVIDNKDAKIEIEEENGDKTEIETYENEDVKPSVKIDSQTGESQLEINE